MMYSRTFRRRRTQKKAKTLMNANTTSESDAATSGEAHVLEDGYEGMQPVVKIREEHNISRRDIDPDALKVLYRLARNNFIAYLVGGGVRDLLLGRQPKDFDISTNAKPEQIRSLFRNCILIGRRFRLAHIRYGEKIIETSTFRSTPKQLADPTDPDADLFQRDDNLFGSPAEDALRRDFTVNGLFYDIESFSIIDYVGGMEDLAARRIRCIGDPGIRFREDPVRMVRAVRFASRLDFTLDAATEEAIHQYGAELTKASPARLLEEITRLFAFSSGERAVRLLRTTGLLGVILPEVDACLDSGAVDHELFWRRLRALDCGDTVLPDATPALIFAVLLADPLKLHLGKAWTFDDTPRLRFDKLHAFLEPLTQRLRFPRKLVDRIIHMYLNQNRFSGDSSVRGKRGFLANFVTQDAFHESLALAEITLSSEGGRQTRLNQWREMLQDRIYGREEMCHQPHHHGNGHHGTGGNGHSGGGNNGNGNERRVVSAPSVVEPEAVSVVSVELERREEGEGGGRKLSRSARRRRNKRLRRQQPSVGEVGGGGVVERASGEGVELGVGVVLPVESEAVKVEGLVEEKRGRRVRSKKVEGEAVGGKEKEKRVTRRRVKKVEEVERVVEEVEAVVEEVAPKPLTAAAFWNEPVVEAEPEPEPEVKKGRGRKAKGESSGKGRGSKASAEKGKMKDKKEVKKEEEELKPSLPLAMDKADEAEIPMHWLDEI